MAIAFKVIIYQPAKPATRRIHAEKTGSSGSFLSRLRTALLALVRKWRHFSCCIASRLYSCGRCSRWNWAGSVNAPNSLDLLAQIPYLAILLLHSCRDEHIFSVEGKIREDEEPELCPCTREGREWSSALCSLGARCMYKLGAHHRVYICVGGPEFSLQRLDHIWMSSPLCLDSSQVPSLCAQSPANIKRE